MRKNLTEIVFILDRSGSMSGLEADTIGGFNAMIQKQKKEEGQALVSTILFSDESFLLHDRVDIRKVPLMTEKDYCACGGYRASGRPGRGHSPYWKDSQIYPPGRCAGAYAVYYYH